MGTTTASKADALVAIELDTGTSQETCDRCGVGTLANYSVVLPSQAELTLCGHHARKYGFVPGLTNGPPIVRNPDATDALDDTVRGYL